MFSKSTRILVVDDMSTMRIRLMNQLKAMGFEHIVMAANGQEALGALQRHSAIGKPLELIVSDWNMPIMSGLDFLLKVKETQDFRHLPFIMVTAEGEKQQVMKAIVNGVTDYIVKPVDREVLQKKLNQIWEKAQAPITDKSENKAA